MSDNNKTRILFVAAGLAQVDSILWAKENNFYVISLDQDKNALGKEFSDEFYVGDITSEKIIIEIFKRAGADGIVSVSCDAALIPVSKACEILNIPGISYQESILSKNKYLQRKTFMGAGLITPKFFQVSSSKQAINSFSQIGKKCVIKPVDSSGSRGVRFIENIADIEKSFNIAEKFSLTGAVIIEEFIEGPEYSIEAIAIDGKPYILAISEKTRTDPPYLLDTSVIFPANLSKTQEEICKKVAKRAIKACHFKNCPVHMEFIISKDGPVIVEIASRGAGSKVFSKILPKISGFDTTKAIVDLAVGKKTNMPSKCLSNKPFAILKFIEPKKGKLRSVDGLNDARSINGIDEIEIYLKTGHRMHSLSSGSDRVGHILAFGKSMIDCQSSIKLAEKLIKIRTN